MNKDLGIGNYESGIYIHVPFCVKKCAYCDFYSVTDLDKISLYIQSVVDETGLTGDLPSSVDSIYFGGGTPSLLEPGQVQIGRAHV